jgi:hypothetical protein
MRAHEGGVLPPEAKVGLAYKWRDQLWASCRWGLCVAAVGFLLFW